METVVTYPSSTVTETQAYLDGTYGFRPSPPKDDPNKWTQPKDKPAQPDRNNFFSLKSEKDFLMASLIPVLLATFLTIPIQIFIKTFNHMIPFRALRYKQRSEGAEAKDSLCLARGGISVFTAPKIGLRFIRKYRDPLPLLSLLLDVFTTLLIPLSSETIQIEFGKNRCASLDSPVVKYGYRGPCAIGLRKSVIPSRAAEVFMSVMSLIILVMGYLLWRWRAGVSADPWSVASMTALLSGSSREVKKLILGITPPEGQGDARDLNDTEVDAATSKDIAKALEGKRFRLGYFQVSPGCDRYGSAQWRHDGKDGRWGGSIRSDTTWGQTGPYQHMSYGLELVSPDEVETGSVRLTVKEPPTRSSTQDKTTQQGSFLGRLLGKFKKLALKLRISKKKENTSTSTVSRKRCQTTSVIPAVFLVLVTGLLILILYYENTILDTPFERFMDSQTYGVRFMFTAMGTGITAFWDWYFAYICEKQHFSQLHAAASKPGHENSSGNPQRPTARAAPASPPSCTCVRVNTTTSTILNAIPSNELSALYHAFFPSRLKFQAPCQCAASNKYNTKRIDLTLASVSLAAFLAKFAPILLSGVPFRNTITWKMHETYTWSLVAVLGYMVLVLTILLFPSQMLRSIGTRGRKENGKKTSPPPAPTSIAGYMYYVCDSVMLRDFEGLSTSPRKVRDKAVMDMAARHHEGHLESRGGQGYAFGTMTGVSGVRRVGIDYADAR
ncbi:hypothetical protein QBC37DRAFT_19376 [Rhypophila decipiens]|uniref:Uncharacterized protein n=1 Tax=Rhypophila decipiens TaxID=261697 RepID=A0AAN6Y834_9PEZI|nr:hypothetical protein QBC37DRAFT_19376 [Rhypophila decipiens]